MKEDLNHLIDLRVFNRAREKKLEELRQAGIDPEERLVAMREQPTKEAAEAQIRNFYKPSTWPENGPKAPPY